jgi:hypothetical protein
MFVFCVYMIKTTKISGEHLLHIYQSNYVVLAHNNVDITYLENSRIRIFFREHEENMVAGFCINSGPAYRTFLPLNSSQLEELYKKQGFDQYPPDEVTCLWMEKGSQHAKWSVYLYFVMFWDVLRSKRKKLIFGTHSKNIKNFFLLAFPKVIFYERLFVQTKNDECDFWILQGSKFTFFKCLALLSMIKLFGGTRRLARFRLNLDKKDQKHL